MRYQFLVGKQLQHASSRVIALGRLLLATLFLVAIGIDISQPAQAPAATYALLLTYIAAATGITVATWNNWWLDARLAGPIHAFDIAIFAALVLLTEAYTSPFFTFFVFLLLSAAIRWGWRETALTAILLTLLYLVIGLVIATPHATFELQRFVVRTGHLVILSLILIWFGVNQWGVRLNPWDFDRMHDAAFDQSPVQSGLQVAMQALGAGSGCFAWLERDEVTCLRADGKEAAAASVRASDIAGSLARSPFLYDVPKRRGLWRDADRNLRLLGPDDIVEKKAMAALGLRKGIAIPVRSDSGEGMLFLEEIANLSIDHIDLGEQLSGHVAAHFQRHALFEAAGESAEARSRLALARDLHDSVVQFLAGAAFRIEALKRSLSSGRAIEAELEELKQLMLQEQGELRSFIAALRTGSQIALNDLAKDLKGLAQRLSRQWAIECSFSARPGRMTVPAKTHQDAQQLVREAVANAVRHAGAKSVTIDLSTAKGELRLSLTNDGTRYPRTGDHLTMPRSLMERVEQAGGNLEVSRGMDVTKLSISLPVSGKSS
jgi:signal transduction histidine kinase